LWLLFKVNHSFPKFAKETEIHSQNSGLCGRVSWKTVIWMLVSFDW